MTKFLLICFVLISQLFSCPFCNNKWKRQYFKKPLKNYIEQSTSATEYLSCAKKEFEKNQAIPRVIGEHVDEWEVWISNVYSWGVIDSLLTLAIEKDSSLLQDAFLLTIQYTIFDTEAAFKLIDMHSKDEDTVVAQIKRLQRTGKSLDRFVDSLIVYPELLNRGLYCNTFSKVLSLQLKNAHRIARLYRESPVPKGLSNSEYLYYTSELQLEAKKAIDRAEIKVRKIVIEVGENSCLIDFNTLLH